MTRLLSPQTMENPIFFHATNTSQYFKQQIDQMAEVGFEMLIYSFDTNDWHFDWLENTSNGIVKVSLLELIHQPF